MLELWELALIAQGVKEREVVTPKVLAVAARNNDASEEELFGLRSYVALEHARVLVALQQREQAELVLSNELNVAILASRTFVREHEIPLLWRVDYSYVHDLFLLAHEEQSVMSLIASEVLAHVQESVLATAPLAAQLLHDVVSGELPAPLGLRLKYASESLARVGFSPITRSINQSMSTTITPEELAVLKQRAIAAQEAIDIASNDIVVLP